MSPVSRSAADEPTSLLRQEIAAIAAVPEVCAVLDWFRQHAAEFTQWPMEVARIPAPPFGEHRRAEWLASQFRELGLEDVQVDEVGNALGLRRANGTKVISVSAHVDTVFPLETALNIRQQNGKLHGPGISDNAAGVAAILALAGALVHSRVGHELPILFIGNVGEEGEGDLRGMRHIFSASAWKDEIAASVIIDGAGTDTIIADALGSRRFEVTIKGPGGHSWTDFGAPNPIVALSRAIARFTE